MSFLCASILMALSGELWQPATKYFYGVPFLQPKVSKAFHLINWKSQLKPEEPFSQQ